MNKHFKVWYTGPMIDWVLDRIVCAEDESKAVSHITDNYPWAIIVDMQEVQHAYGDDSRLNEEQLAI